MATVRDGENPGRQGDRPQRQSPTPGRNGISAPGLDPTEQQGQTPPDIFGFAQSYHTGAPGSAGGQAGNVDVTVQAGQLDEGLAGVSGSEITSTGLDGTQGGRKPSGGDMVRYTDPFGYMGNDHRESTTSAHIDGSGDWTQANDMGYDSGPTLPALEGCRPTSTGAGEGHVGVKHPNAGH